MKPTYFDLTVRDIGQARKFFQAVFDWKFERFPMPYEYYRIQAGPGSEAGIDGGIGMPLVRSPAGFVSGSSKPIQRRSEPRARLTFVKTLSRERNSVRAWTARA